jgi:sensor histidine kinase YesM
MENLNEKLILDENLHESTDSYQSPLIYKFVSYLYNLVSVIIVLASFAIFVHTLYLYFTNPPIEKYVRYSDSFYTAINDDEITQTIIFLGFLAWIGLTIGFHILNWVEHGRLAQKKWVLFNTISAVITFLCIIWLVALFD